MQFPSYKIIYNNTSDALTCMMPLHTICPNKARTNHYDTIAFSSNITKIITPLELTLYLQIIRIANKSLTPIVIIHLYMPTHKENIYIILDIQQTIKQTLSTHSTHFPILKGDFKQDRFLNGPHNQHSLTQPTNEEKEWQAN